MKKLLFTFLLISGAINLSFSQLNITELGNLTWNAGDLSDVWGYVDGQGNEYALVGLEEGFSVVDVSDPTNPTEVFWIDGPHTIWRDIKVWDNHAYVTNEGDEGLLIVDLSTLPGNANLATTTYTGVNYDWSAAHNLYIDENGICYIFGADYSNGGAIMLDLTQDPMLPVEVGLYDEYYIHDGVARGDTLWASCISDGFQVALDVTDKMAPLTLANWYTPNSFAHNCWIDDRGDYIYTTDEKPNSYITAYDVSDLGNVTEVDRYQSNPGMNVIPHNSHWMNDYVITSYYRDGVNVLDVSNPAIMVEVGNYDTSPAYSGNGFNGAWGAYPWLPSGLLLVTDIERGLFCLDVDYQRAAYLIGTVTDAGNSNVLDNVSIEILSTNVTATSGIGGEYATGYPAAGSFDVSYSRQGYISQIISVSLTQGGTSVQDVQMESLLPFQVTGTVLDGSTNSGIPFAHVLFENNLYTYDTITDANGDFTFPSIFADTYTVYGGQWNYDLKVMMNHSIDTINNQVEIVVPPGIYDDFIFDLGWTVSGDANPGDWERGNPIGTSYDGDDANPGDDATDDFGEQCYVTGNGGGSGGTDDVDDGTTILTSPSFDLTGQTNPHLFFHSWFYNGGGTGGAVNDEMKIKINNGLQTVEMLQIDNMSPQSGPMSEWVWNNIKITDHVDLTNNMTVIFEVSDNGEGHIVEAAIDKFMILDTIDVSVNDRYQDLGFRIKTYPNPVQDHLFFEYQIPDGEVTVRVMSSMGRVVDQLVIGKGFGTKNMAFDYTAGVYYVRFSAGVGAAKTIKIIKQ